MYTCNLNNCEYGAVQSVWTWEGKMAACNCHEKNAKKHLVKDHLIHVNLINIWCK